MIQKSSFLLDIPRKRGKDVDDVTSFHPAYKTNGPDRENRHKILFRYEQDGYAVPPYAPETWIFRGRIVLDMDDKPVKKWHELPLVLSSEYEGYDMEVVRRLNPKISFGDIRARMPRLILIGTRWSDLAQSTLSMRNMRFRLAACCLAWTDRQGSQNIKNYLDALLPPECLAANSTENFRDLTPHEVEQAGAANAGNFRERAGERALDDETRQQRNEVRQKRSKILLARHIEIMGDTSLVNLAPGGRGQKRKRAQSSSDPEDEEQNARPAKRPEWAANIDPRLWGFRSSGDASVPVVGSAPASENASNSIGGLGRMNRPSNQNEIPEFTVGNPNSEVQAFRFEEDLGLSEFAREGSSGFEYTPLYEERPAAKNAPYYLNDAQWQTLVKKQAADDEVDFRLVRPTNECEQNSIQMALHYTRKDCHNQLGARVRLRSSPGKCYWDQYQEILKTFRRYRGSQVPALIFLEKWGGDLHSWKARSIEQE